MHLDSALMVMEVGNLLQMLGNSQYETMSLGFRLNILLRNNPNNYYFFTLVFALLYFMFQYLSENTIIIYDVKGPLNVYLTLGQ